MSVARLRLRERGWACFFSARRARTIVQRARPGRIHEQLDGLRLPSQPVDVRARSGKGGCARGRRAHLVDVLRREVLCDSESQLGFGDVLTSLQAVVALVSLECGHVKLREIHRLHQRGGHIESNPRERQRGRRRRRRMQRRAGRGAGKRRERERERASWTATLIRSVLTHQAPRILVGARRPITSSCRTTLLLLIPLHLLGSLLDRDSRALGVAKVGAAEVRADLPLSDHAARGLCHLVLVAGLAQQGAGVVAAGGASARNEPSATRAPVARRCRCTAARHRPSGSSSIWRQSCYSSNRSRAPSMWFDVPTDANAETDDGSGHKSIADSERLAENAPRT